MTQIIQIFGTGGTFDKAYHVTEEKMKFHQNSVVKTIIDKAKILDCAFESLMKIDSLDMDEDHRARLVHAIENSVSKKIVIVHGTSTMTKTARHLSETIGTSRLVVLTGALVPFRYDPVEATANFSMAISACRLIKEAGIYISMHGQVLPFESIEKVNRSGAFRRKDQ